MKKEVLLAIIIGFALGLVITFGIWTANKALKKTAPQNSQPETTVPENTLPTPTPTQLLIISSPNDNSISNSEKLLIEGKANPNSSVVVIYPDSQKVTETDKSGNFSVEITLIGGANEIKVTNFDNQGNEISKIINVVYTTTKI